VVDEHVDGGNDSSLYGPVELDRSFIVKRKRGSMNLLDRVVAGTMS
jgi:hypothetical protein